LFKGLAGLASLMKQAQGMGGKVQEIQADLRSKRVVGEAGGGMVQAELNGLGQVVKVTIDPQLVAGGEQEMIEDLIPAAVNAGIQKSKQLHLEAMKSVTQGISLPGLDLEGALSQIAGVGPGEEGETPGSDDEEKSAT
jgi:DNA-binding YbaB/EbfC family protein